MFRLMVFKPFSNKITRIKNILCLYTYCVYVIQGVSKILTQILGVRFRQQNRRKIPINIFPQAQHRKFWKQSLLYFYLWEHLKSVAHSFPPHRRILYACQTISTIPGTLEMARQSMIWRALIQVEHISSDCCKLWCNKQ